MDTWARSVDKMDSEEMGGNSILIQRKHEEDICREGQVLDQILQISPFVITVRLY